jgi:xanthine dehydrogenase accessory factor
MATSMMAGRAAELRGRRVSFVSATVVRAERPTSAKPGDTAIVLADGTIEGFVGGACAETSVRAQALSCLAAGESVLLRIVPDTESDSGGDPVGVTTVANPCLSGGTLEIFLEPVVPPALVYTIGSSPIALALSRGAGSFGFDLRLVDELPDPLPDDTAAVVVASHGRGEEAALTAALSADVPYIGLVASRRRAAAVLETLQSTHRFCGGHTDRIHTPAGLDLGAETPEEVAISILAQIVAERPRRARTTDDEGSTAAATATTDEPSASGAATAVDPVCGMTVAAVPASLQVEHNGETVYFCGPGCVQAFTANPDQYQSSN